MSLRRFDGKVALVTGAASGIGRAVALRLAAEGGRLLLADRDLDGARAVADAIAAEGAPDAAAIGYDAADAASCRAMVDAALARAGRLDVLVNNAGLYRRGHFETLAAEDWALVLEVDLNSVFHVTRRALPALIESRGNVVATASTAALGGIAYAAPYAAAKAGVVALMKSLAIEFAPRGVRFNVVCPGRVRTAIGAGLAPLGDENPDLLVRPPRLDGFAAGGAPDDLAGAYAYLASDDARYVTGAVLVVDGAQPLA